ncbi:MAG: integrase [Hyphomicrobium sp.]|nr:integrase [Hyphomicrobium sp.]
MNLRDFLGGHPVAVAIRLAIISILVGLILSVFGITPRNFFYVVDNFARYVYDMGFDAVVWIFEYLALGAMLVVPIWVVIRVLRSGRSSPD